MNDALVITCANNCPLLSLSFFLEEGVQYQGKECSGELVSVFHIYSCKLFLPLTCQITGGSSGIGKCLAIDAIKRGVASVTLVARNKVTTMVAHHWYVTVSIMCTGETCSGKGRH